MINAIAIENLRGIRRGRLDGLAPLTILTGPNACGKSTVLDALLIGASPDPAEALGQAVTRHPVVLGGARWLFGASANRRGDRLRPPDPGERPAVSDETAKQHVILCEGFDDRSFWAGCSSISAAPIRRTAASGGSSMSGAGR